MRIAQQRVMQVGALLDSFAQAASREALSATGGLHVGLVVVAVAAQHHRQAGHALTTDEADFDGMFAISIGHDRGEPAVGKVDGFDRPTTPFQDLEERQIGGLQMRLEQLKVSVRQTRQDEVFVGKGHGSSPAWGKSTWHLPAVRALRTSER